MATVALRPAMFLSGKELDRNGKRAGWRFKQADEKGGCEELKCRLEIADWRFENLTDVNVMRQEAQNERQLRGR